MYQYETIGNDLTHVMVLNLLPGMVLPAGYYQIDIQFVTVNKFGTQCMHHTSYVYSTNAHVDRNFNIRLGSDVEYLDYRIMSLHTNVVAITHQMKSRHLVLLNLATRLLKT